MKIGLYVVTEAIEANGRSVEIVSLEEDQGGVYEDGALALQAILTNLGGELRGRCAPLGSHDPWALLRPGHQPVQNTHRTEIKRRRVYHERLYTAQPHR